MKILQFMKIVKAVIGAFYQKNCTTATTREVVNTFRLLTGAGVAKLRLFGSWIATLLTHRLCTVMERRDV